MINLATGIIIKTKNHVGHKIILLFLIGGITLANAQTDNGVMRMDEFRNPQKDKLIQIPGFGGFQTFKMRFSHAYGIFRRAGMAQHQGTGSLAGRTGCDGHL
jgi:hypothetical protein